MKYRLFIYSTAGCKGSMIINTVNRNLRCSFPEWDKGNEPERHMRSFDTGRITEMIKAELSSEMNKKTDVIEKQSPQKKIAYLCIETDFPCVEQIWPSLTKIALQEQLVLLDA